jgi:hypothetical protein
VISDINRQVRHYSTCVCFIFLRVLPELYKLRFQSGDEVESRPTLSTDVKSDMENSNFGFFLSLISHVAQCL